MIKFFRHIRKRLLSENRFSKYLIYAIGEIILVVIGIVIALQLNISYTNKQSQNTIRKYLSELKKEIGQNGGIVNGWIGELNRNIEVSNRYLKIINTQTPNTVQDSTLINMIGELGPTNLYPLANSVFDDFNSSGLINSIKNDSLKRAVILIETRINSYNFAKEELVESWNKQLLPYYTKYANLMQVFDSIQSEKIPPSYIKLDRVDFINNKEFNNVIMSRMITSSNSLYRLERIKTRFEALQNDIDKYLETND
ncbi:MAG: hypothetical protein ED556_02000 [Winogradskyella sp.]|uniref:hypothetical protein n=1 Tax=Winogradskyella sp. TaxID=1883156 RepID=UPI000F41852E|nr:hypothetical protein [Winogradskyella sp.]RNC87985.1 MAG: hypothetical protein ED556_02000 [Winogradskyella sp.]